MFHLGKIDFSYTLNNDPFFLNFSRKKKLLVKNYLKEESHRYLKKPFQVDKIVKLD